MLALDANIEIGRVPPPGWMAVLAAWMATEASKERVGREHAVGPACGDKQKEYHQLLMPLPLPLPLLLLLLR